MEFWHLFRAGGFMMYPLVIASIAVVAIFIERFNYYKKCRSDTQLITGMLREYIPGGKFDELADALAKDGGIPASVILDGVKCIHLKADQNELIEGASSRAVGELRKYLNYLDTTCNGKRLPLSSRKNIKRFDHANNGSKKTHQWRQCNNGIQIIQIFP